MQVIRDEDKNSNVYIKSFKKDHKYITMKMADNSKPRYLNVEDVEVKTIELMWNQHFLNMEELPNLYYKHQVAKSIMLASLVLLICFIGLNLPNLGLNSYLIPIGIFSSTLISANSMMKNAAKIIELKKEDFLLENETLLNNNIEIDNPNHLEKVSSKTKKVLRKIEKERIKEDVPKDKVSYFNINDIERMSLEDLKNIKANLERENYLGLVTVQEEVKDNTKSKGRPYVKK